MDPIKLEKIQAINKHHRTQQLLLNNIFLYSLTALTCSLFCSATPLCYPPLFSCLKVFLSLSLPQISTYLFFSSKFLFIVGNLNIIFLVGESKMFSSSSEYSSSFASDVYYDDFVNHRNKRRICSDLSSINHSKKEEKLMEVPSDQEEVPSTYEVEEERGGGEEEKVYADKDIDGEEFDNITMPAEELNKRADDFIARVNQRRRLEAALLISNATSHE